MNPPDPKLTVAEIHHLLTHLNPKKAEPTPASSGPPASPERLRRLMEIYCVVKAGGVQVQTEAAQAHLSRELAQLKAELAEAETQRPNSSRSAILHQEIEDLRRSVHWRLTRLRGIDPNEEAAVAACLTEIEQGLSDTPKYSGEA
ncbi:MAG: hypothetical protein ICV62_16755 [Cyanobacteria bacterium Co-bin13]|nr:hypothetical protein [Cyanobacteria bacterium Co-bin13]